MTRPSSRSARRRKNPASSRVHRHGPEPVETGETVDVQLPTLPTRSCTPHALAPGTNERPHRIPLDEIEIAVRYCSVRRWVGRGITPWMRALKTFRRAEGGAWYSASLGSRLPFNVRTPTPRRGSRTPAMPTAARISAKSHANTSAIPPPRPERRVARDRFRMRHVQFSASSTRDA